MNQNSENSELSKGGKPLDPKQSDFYSEVLESLLKRTLLKKTDSVLVVCGGRRDYNLLRKLGFFNVTITNVDTRLKENPTLFHPFIWNFQHSDNLTYNDESFDVVIVHSGLHHLSVPPKGVTEMYRVARKLVIGFEPHDCRYTRWGVTFGFGQEFETAAVFDNSCKFGGVDNSEIPNHVFRFSSGLIRQIIKSYDPTSIQKFEFLYRTRIPRRLFMLRSRGYGLVVAPITLLMERCGRIPVFANNIAFIIHKPAKGTFLRPWIQYENNRFTVRKDYLESEFSSS